MISPFGHFDFFVIKRLKIKHCRLLLKTNVVIVDKCLEVKPLDASHMRLTGLAFAHLTIGVSEDLRAV